MANQERHTFAWTDLLWLVFLGGLAFMDPVYEIHKQGILLAIGLFQIFERRLLAWIPSRGRFYSVIIKILLATLLMEHTGDQAGGINSSYYLIYFLPVMTAALYFEATGTLIWTAITSAAYCSLLISAYMQNYELTPESAKELILRNIFFFLAAMLVNPFVSENRRQAQRYRLLAEELTETNRRLEQAQEEARRSERLAALGQLTAGLAHEIRNPLAVIKGSAETLIRRLQSADPVTTEVAGYISSEVNRLNSIVTRFLNFARPLKLERKQALIPPLLDRALKVAHDRWPDSKVDVVKQYSEDLPEKIVDPDLCEQAFTNLVLNAYEAMPESGGRLTVRVAAANSEGRRGVEVDVEDSGPGVPPSCRSRSSIPFSQPRKKGWDWVSRSSRRSWMTIAAGFGFRATQAKGACFRLFLPAE